MTEADMPEEHGGAPEDVELEAAIMWLLRRAEHADVLVAAPRGENGAVVRAWHMANAAAIRKVLPYASAALTQMRGLGPNPPMMPIVNQSWCPFADEHQPHVQCQECTR